MEERERRLWESEERYRSFIEQSTEGIWRFELEEPVPTGLTPNEQVERFYRHGYLAECNDAMARMYGYTQAEEIVGARLGDLLPPSIPENVEYLRAFICSGYLLTDAEFQEVDRHGNTKHFLSHLTGIVENESLVRVWASQRDITKRKPREEALQISETRFRAMIEQSPLGIQILSPDGRTLQVNRAWEELWGVTLDDVAGYNLLEDQQLVAKGIMPYIQRGFAGEPTPIPPIMYDPDQIIPGLTSHEEPKRWVRAFIYPVNDEAGNVREVILIHEDITERKHAEEALQYQLGLTRTITNNAADSLFLWDTEGRVTFMNPAAEQTFGWRQEELLGEILHDRMHHHHPDGRAYPISECPLVRVFESGQTLHDHEDLFFRRDGSPIDVACSLAPIVVDGKITGAVLVVRDITERKQAEQEIRKRQRQQATISSLGIQALEGTELFALMDEAVTLVARTLA